MLIIHDHECPALCRDVLGGCSHYRFPDGQGHACTCTAAAKLRELVEAAGAMIPDDLGPPERFPEHWKERKLYYALQPFRERPE